MEEIKVGSIVELLSGGPKMTVEAILGSRTLIGVHAMAARDGGYVDGDPYCSWFESGNKLKKNFFHKEALRPAAD